jgi:hypothetical protein
MEEIKLVKDNLSSTAFSPAHLEDATLSRFGLVFFNHLIGEYDSFTNITEGQAAAYQKLGDLKNVYVGNTRPLTWGDLAALECLTLQLRTMPELRERFWGIQRRYQEVIPKGVYPELVVDRTALEKLSLDELRARTEVLACEFFRLCILAMCREDIRDRASKRLWITMIVFAVLYGVPLGLVYFGGVTILIPLRTLASILFFGSIGGFLSARGRIQSITGHGESLVGIIELSSLSGIWGDFWPPITGAIFAVILYAMFAGGLLDGALFPMIASSSGHVGLLSNLFCRECGPQGALDAAKLLLWSFVAGFAERFVPDTLTRLVSASQGKPQQGKA